MKNGYFETRTELITWYMQQVWEHEDAGERGDADNTRKWLKVKLAQFDRGEKVRV